MFTVHDYSLLVPKETLLTQVDMEAIDKILKDNGSNLAFEDLVVGMEALNSESSGDATATLETIQHSLRLKGLTELADSLREKLKQSE